jgi:hypothetical protein
MVPICFFVEICRREWPLEWQLGPCAPRWAALPRAIGFVEKKGFMERSLMAKALRVGSKDCT